MDKIDEYIADMKFAWAASTLKSERRRLQALKDYLHLSPEALYEKVVHKFKPYSLKTMIIRMVHYNDWLIEKGYKEGPNAFKAFQRKHRNLFKHSYERKKVRYSFEEAERLIKNTMAGPTKKQALEMLYSGLRLAETYRQSGGMVKGKGGKSRKVFFVKPIEVSKRLSPRSVQLALNKIGLNPHDLRKLYATRLVDKGAQPMDLCKALGWSSIKTAYYYIQPKQDDELQELISE